MAARRVNHDLSPPPAQSVLSLAAVHGSGTDLAHMVAAHLGWRELICLGRANKFYQQICASDDLWERQCSEFWADKVFVPSKCQRLAADRQHRKAFGEAIRDSKRTWISAEELCSFDWHGRMKEAAGDHFTDSDPWWTGRGTKPPSRFHMDGTTTRGAAQTRSGEWRFVRSTCGRTGPVGSFVRMKHSGLGGRETPTKIVYRHKNWGWVLDGCWSVSASFPLPPQGQDPSLEDEALQVTVETQQEEAMAYNYGLPMPDERIEGGASGGEEGGAACSEDGDSTMVTVDVNGTEISLPVHALFELMRQNQLDQLDTDDSDSESSSEEDGDHGNVDAASSMSEDDRQCNDDNDADAEVVSRSACG